MEVPIAYVCWCVLMCLHCTSEWETNSKNCHDFYLTLVLEKCNKSILYFNVWFPNRKSKCTWNCCIYLFIVPIYLYLLYNKIEKLGQRLNEWIVEKRHPNKQNNQLEKFKAITSPSTPLRSAGGSRIRIVSFPYRPDTLPHSRPEPRRRNNPNSHRLHNIELALAHLDCLATGFLRYLLGE